PTSLKGTKCYSRSHSKSCLPFLMFLKNKMCVSCEGELKVNYANVYSDVTRHSCLPFLC
ncbi:hypothetical protein M5D96_013826, partial [Drosophila gunungcola]